MVWSRTMEPTHTEQLTRKERRLARREEKRHAKDSHATRRSLRRVASYGGIVFVLVLAGWGMWRLAARTPSAGTSDVLAVDVTADDHVRGNPEAPVTLVEYSDFQCPACASFEPVVVQLLQDAGDTVRLVYRHFPLRNIHSNADLAARAAEAAALQGKFWEMHDLLFDGQALWSGQSSRGAEDTFAGYAEAVGLDVERFRNDIDSDAVRDAVNEDYEGGVRARVNSTPSFFVNGRKEADFVSLEDFYQRVLGAATITASPSVSESELPEPTPLPDENQ